MKIKMKNRKSETIENYSSLARHSFSDGGSEALVKVRGFTLVELLVVIAIIGVMATASIVLLNPAEILRQTRDSNRIADMTTLKTAIVTYIADTGAKAYIGDANTCYAHPSSTLGACSDRFASGGGIATWSPGRQVDGSGWIPINFTIMSVKPPISSLPLDPTNNATYFYAYKVNPQEMVFKLTGKMESEKYSNGGSGNVEVKDGGANPDLFEVGTDLHL